MLLMKSGEAVPQDLEVVLLELGAGDNRFKGTSFGRGECSLAEFLQECKDGEDERMISAHMVPQSVCWLMVDSGRMVGIVRVRHRLNERLIQYGGHIGYYVRPSERGKGYGKEALRLGLSRLGELGVSRALLTVNPSNIASIQVVLSNRGVQDGQGIDSVSGEVVNRYWIDL